VPLQAPLRCGLAAMDESKVVTLLDYGAGNVCSVVNAIEKGGFTIKRVEKPEDIAEARVIVFPGVGAFGSAMESLDSHGYTEPLKEYLRSGRPYFGICLGMQTLFEGSEESPGLSGLGIIPGQVTKFDPEALGKSVPQIGWNGVKVHKECCVSGCLDKPDTRVYFVHSYRAPLTDENREHALCTTNYGNDEYISAVQYGNIVATQFHPEKSASTGLRILKSYLDCVTTGQPVATGRALPVADAPTTLARRIIACLDVRTNDQGDLVVTKGDQYDVREESEAADAKGAVRNLGKPVELAQRYYDEGADEISFLNITSFREGVLEDMPMLRVLEEASKGIFVPLTVGGGIRSYTDPQTNTTWSALDVASRYFRAGADKVSIGSDAVYAAEGYYAAGNSCSGGTSIEEIARVYGRQAVVVSVDPRRVYVNSEADAPGKTVLRVTDLKDGAEKLCWYQCTVRGGREGRDMDAVQLAVAVEALGCGEILLNCVDMDGQGQGYDHGLISAVANAVSIPVIASSGAGAVEHFSAVFNDTKADAALAAGIFHRREIPITAVKEHVRGAGIPCRAAENGERNGAVL